MFEMVPWRRNNNGVQKRGDLFEDMINSFFNNDFLVPSKVFGNNFLVDLKETDTEYTITADLPGVDKENISLSYDNGYLTIAAKRENVVEDKKESYVRQERSYGEFRRCFYMNNIDHSAIDAKFNNGVLSIKAPKLQEEKRSGRQIDIN
ncbi:heat shock protein Hsp18 [Alloiococcus sp. CFN-8]|uniref:heat shock protein Hsp18 n=1 Tax=Alloiococcus sp. CFN-8 TaxID=3416081 RepID=UPI003CED770E